MANNIIYNGERVPEHFPSAGASLKSPPARLPPARSLSSQQCITARRIPNNGRSESTGVSDSGVTLFGHQKAQQQEQRKKPKKRERTAGRGRPRSPDFFARDAQRESVEAAQRCFSFCIIFCVYSSFYSFYFPWASAGEIYNTPVLLVLFARAEYNFIVCLVFC